MEKELIDMLIIGSGIGGVSAGVYATRSGLSVKIVDKSGLIGGQIWNTSEIDNFIGIPSTDSATLNKQLEEQVISNGIDVDYGEVESINKEGDIFKTVTDMGEIYSKTVIIATGTEHNKLGITGEEMFSGTGVSYCAVCDGNFYEGKHVAVIGGGDSALEEALYLSNIAKKVTVIHRRNDFRAKQDLVNRAVDKGNIDFILNVNVIEFFGNDELEKIMFVDNETATYNELEVDGAFIYVGSTPQTIFLDSRLLDKGEIIVDLRTMSTLEKGLYAIGDVRKDSVRQLGTAVGDGITASLSAYKYIQELYN